MVLVVLSGMDVDATAPLYSIAPDMPAPKVFICYARSDNESSDPKERWLDRVQEHLKPFVRQGDIEVFCDDLIELGDDWHQKIQSQLSEARVVLLLVSSRFLASEYIANSELPVLLDRARTQGVRIIPIVVSPSAYDSIQFKYPDPEKGPEKRKLSTLQSAGSPTEALCEVPYGRQERILKEVAQFVARYAAPPHSNPAQFQHRSNKIEQAAEIPAGSPPRAPVSPSNGTSGTDVVVGLSRRRLMVTIGTIGLVGAMVLLSIFLRAPARRHASSLTNGLGMILVPISISGTNIWFSVWETRLRDYEAYEQVHAGSSEAWKNPVDENVPITPGPDHPVVNITWEEATQFCAWLTQKERAAGLLKEDQTYRLPTDLEWSRAIGTTNEMGTTPADRDAMASRMYPWGTNWPPANFTANYADESAKSKFGENIGETISGYLDGYPTTSPVGSYPALANGVFDLSGNVWEWCEDWYDSEKKYRVLRGGSWRDADWRTLLSSYRSNFDPDGRSYSVGFRVVLVGDGSTR